MKWSIGDARGERVGVDTGGTFTDLVLLGRGGARILKVPSTPHDPSQAVIHGLSELGLLKERIPVIHGTTVATNAFLQRRGGRTALVTTSGFEDVLALGRQARPHLYRLDPPPRKIWVPDRLRIGIVERRGPRGEERIALRSGSLARLRRRLLRLRIDAVAVCLLHAYADPRNERAVARALRGTRWHLSLSHRVTNEFREYERTCTTVANASLAGPVTRYLTRLGRILGRNRLRIMTSSAGWISPRRATTYPVRTVLSGPEGIQTPQRRLLHLQASGLQTLLESDGLRGSLIDPGGSISIDVPTAPLPEASLQLLQAEPPDRAGRRTFGQQPQDRPAGNVTDQPGQLGKQEVHPTQIPVPEADPLDDQPLPHLPQTSEVGKHPSRYDEQATFPLNRQVGDDFGVLPIRFLRGIVLQLLRLLGMSRVDPDHSITTVCQEIAQGVTVVARCLESKQHRPALLASSRQLRPRHEILKPRSVIAKAERPHPETPSVSYRGHVPPLGNVDPDHQHIGLDHSPSLRSTTHGRLLLPCSMKSVLPRSLSE